jgi:hypothetical protein
MQPAPSRQVTYGFPMPPEKRKKPRKSMHYDAWMQVQGEPPQGCVLSDISDSGARIETARPDEWPEYFTLLLTRTGSARRICRVVWRKQKAIGVRFQKPQ